VIVGYFLDLIPENLRWLPTLGGAFPAALAAFPVKEIFERKDRMAALRIMKAKLQSGEGEVDPGVLEQVRNLINKLV
jgi:hypothetical protein